MVVFFELPKWFTGLAKWLEPGLATVVPAQASQHAERPVKSFPELLFAVREKFFRRDASAKPHEMEDLCLRGLGRGDQICKSLDWQGAFTRNNTRMVSAPSMLPFKVTLSTAMCYPPKAL